MNKAKLNELFSKINSLAEELELTKVAYKRLGEDRGSSMKLVLGDYWKLSVAHQNCPASRGMDMIVLGLQKYLTARTDKLKAEIIALKAEIDKEIGSAS